MKKLIFIFIAMITLSVMSCNVKTETPANTEDSTLVMQADTTLVDTLK